MSTIKETLRILGILLGTLSVVSLAQAVFNVGLVPTFEEFITFYRGLVANVFWILTTLIGFKPPQSVLDFWTLSFLGASAYVRVQGIEQSRALRGLNLNPQSLWWRVVLLLIFGFSGFGLGIVFSTFNPMTYIDAFHVGSQDLMKGAVMNVVLIFVGAIVFFIVNAYAPSK